MLNPPPEFPRKPVSGPVSVPPLRRVAVIHPTALATPARFLKLLDCLKSSDIEATVFTLRSNIVDLPHRLDGIAKVQFLDKLPIIPPEPEDSCWLLRQLKDGRRRLRAAIEARKLAKKIAAQDFDAVHCVNWPLTMLALALHKKGLSLIYETHEYTPSVLEHSGLSFTRRYQKRCLRLERKVLEKAYCTIVVSDEFVTLYHQNVPNARIVTTYNVPLQNALPPTSLHYPIKLYFQSVLRPTYGIRTILEALQLLGDREFHFDLQGGFYPLAYRETLQNDICTLGLKEKVRILDPCPLEDVVSAANNYDLGIHAIPEYDQDQRITNHVYSLPNKVFTYASAGLGLVFPNFCLSMHRLLDESGAVAWIDVNDPQQIANTLADLLDHPERIETMKSAAHQWAQGHNIKTENKKVQTLYRELFATLQKP